MTETEQLEVIAHVFNSYRWKGRADWQVVLATIKDQTVPLIDASFYPSADSRPYSIFEAKQIAINLIKGYKNG